MKPQTKDLSILDQVVPLVENVPTLQIKNKEDLTRATEELSLLNQKLDAITADKERITKPINASLKEIRGRYKPAEEALNNAIDLIRSKMTRYQTDLINAQQAEEQAIASRIGAGKGHLKMETAMKKIDELEKAPKIVETDSGSLVFVATPKLKVTDRHAIPLLYWTLDESALLKDLKAGKIVAGAEIEIVQIPRNSR